jgi:hypothetical protein
MNTSKRPAGDAGFWTDAWSVVRDLIGVLLVVLAAGAAIALITHLIALPLRLLHWAAGLVA